MKSAMEKNKGERTGLKGKGSVKDAREAFGQGVYVSDVDPD